MKEIKRINSVEQWSKIQSAEQGSHRVIFKNSGRCFISAGALREYQKWASNIDSAQNIELYIVDVVYDRNISNRIAEDTKIWHQSPQIIWLSPDGEVIFDTSHSQIKFNKLNQLMLEKEV